MSALQEWYRYVDSLVRPSRKFEELEEWWVPEDALGRGGAKPRSDELNPIAEQADEPEATAPDAPAFSTDSCAASRTPLPPTGPGRSPLFDTPAPPKPPVVDPRTVVARISDRVHEPTPTVEWTTVRGECKIPDLEQFIPDLSTAAPTGSATREFIEGVARFQVPPRKREPAPPLPPLAPVIEPEADPAPPSPRGEDRRSRTTFNPSDWLTPSGTLRPTREVSPPPASEPGLAPLMTDEATDEEEELDPPVDLTPVAVSPLPMGSSAPMPIEDLLLDLPAPTPIRDLLLDLPDELSADERGALPTIGSIREGLPRTMERLLRIPITEEVAQNSYKSQFRESREELIQRLFDPPLTLEDTARLLGVCPTTVRRYTNKGLLQHYRTQGNQRRFRLSDLLAFLERWGDAGPEAGALGGSASTRRVIKGGSKASRKVTGITRGSQDEEKGEQAAAAEDTERSDAD